MWRVFLIIFLGLSGFSALADNLKVKGHVMTLAGASKVMELEVRLSWENSWRNEGNYDAVYLFCKYATEKENLWKHLFLDTSENAQEAGTGFTVKIMNEGRGMMVFRSEEGQGKSETTLRLKFRWDEEETDPEKVYISLQGLEMVYVPTGPFYAGGGNAVKPFPFPYFGVLPLEYDIIGTHSSFVYSASSNSNTAAYAADRADHTVTKGWSSAAGAFPAWWMVDFKTPKRILYFGVSGGYSETFPAAPATTWYLEGSATGGAEDWHEVWSGGAEQWGNSRISYPVQQAIAVKNPGDYRYYRIRVEDTRNKDFWNNIRIANVGMTEEDLGTGSGPFLVDGFLKYLPAPYPDGVKGFYTMKYELSQEQYVNFLNQLPRSAQYTRTIGGLLDGLEEGKYVFGDHPELPSDRNGIILQERRLNSAAPYLFACDLNPANKPNALDDGQTIACNYLSPSDMLAYADWCGLRPLSELEYEKMCRGIYPVRPELPDYAWGSEEPVAASGWENKGSVQEKTATGNVNAGKVLEGPARVGVFLREGKRVITGNSVLGVGDLNGNLSEIYCSVNIWGKQLNGLVHGTGNVNFNGTPLVNAADWPREVKAYGVRGGGYNSPLTELNITNRSGMEDYFESMTQRKPEVGFRLGISEQDRTLNSSLTLENGQVSGHNMVYDTVCDISEYVIKGNIPVETGCWYFWYKSTDNGFSWKRLEGELEPDLRLSNLTDEVMPNVKQNFLYKRVAYDRYGYAETTVGLTIAHGFHTNRLWDTIWPCMDVKGFTVTTPLPARYEWTCLDNGKKLLMSAKEETSSSCKVEIEDIQEGEAWPTGIYTIGLKMKLAGRCEIQQNLEIHAVPHTKDPFAVKAESFTFDASGRYQVLPGCWGGKGQTWTWSIYSGVSTHKINAKTALLSGKNTDTMCNIVVGVVCDNMPDKEWKKNVQEVRTFDGVGISTIKLLPGSYRMECWGAQGGTACQDWRTTAYGGNGGYASGILDLSEGRLFYLYVGGYGGGNGAGPGWNGGGQGGRNTDGEPGGSGGGASDIRLAGDLDSRIMVAGGGGGAGNYSTGPGGGGINGYSSGGAGGTQTSGNSFGTGGTGGPDGGGRSGGGGGGGGYWGGYGAPQNRGGGGGGSGFVSGMPGCNAKNANGTFSGQPNHYSGLIFRNASMLNGQRGGNGAIRISVK